MTRKFVQRYHDFSSGHRVFGHESACAHLHGHNYRVHFYCEAPALDSVGRVIDFSEVKGRLCMWLEDNWDHKFIVYTEDPWLELLRSVDPAGVVGVPFNPTAENMATYLLEVVGPKQLAGTTIELVRVVVDETRKCSAMADLG